MALVLDDRKRVGKGEIPLNSRPLNSLILNRLIRTTVLAMGGIFLVGCVASDATLDDMEVAVSKALAAPPVDLRSGDGAPVSYAEGFAVSLRAAVLSSQAYVAAQALEAEAISGIAVVQSGRRSQLSANGTVGALREGSPTSETTVGASGDVMLSQLVYDGGAIGGAVDAATAVAVAAQADRLAQGNTIALEAARAWVHYWQADRRLGYLDEATADLADVIEQVDRMAASGMLDQAAVENVRKQHLGIQLERGALAAARSEAALRFALYFGEAPRSLAQPAPLLTPQTARARAAEWQTAPALKRIAAEVFAAKGAEQEALAAFKPVIRMQGGVNTPMDVNDTTDVSAGLRIQYVFNDGGRRKAQLAAAKQRVFALEAQFTDARRVAQTEMQASLVQLAALEEAIALVQEKSVLTQSEVEIARSQIATGQVNLQQLLTAEIENYRAVDQSIQLQGEKHVLLLTIAAQSGYLTKLIGLDG